MTKNALLQRLILNLSLSEAVRDVEFVFLPHVGESPSLASHHLQRSQVLNFQMLRLLHLSPIPIRCLLLTACDQPRSPPSCRLSLFPSLPSVLPVSRTLYKTDECLCTGSMPVVLGGNFPQHSRPTVYICHFLFTPPSEALLGCVDGVYGDKLSVW